MSLRDLFVFGIVALSIPLGFRVPFIGLLTFSWLAYMRAQDLCWGFARNMRFSFYVSIAMLLGWVFHEAGKRRFTRLDFRTGAMMLLGILTLLSLLQARDQSSYVMRRFFEFVKIIAIALFTVGQVDSRQRLRTILWTIALSLGFFGIKGGLFGILTGGAQIHRGPGGMLEDNNDFALALVMNMPLLFYLGQVENRPWIKKATLLGVILTMLTVMLTHSRGGFLSMCAVIGVFWLRARKKMIGVIALLFFVFGFFFLAPQHVRDRIFSIGQYKKDSSAMGRLRAWTIALRMIGAYPVFGVGMRNYQVHWDEFKQGISFGESYAPVAHNSYLQIWAEGGTLSFLTYLALLGGGFVACRRLRRLGLSVRGGEWIFHYARMFEASLVAFVVGATFLNRGHFDLIYHLLALISCLMIIARRWTLLPEHEREESAEEELAPLRLPGLPEKRPPRGFGMPRRGPRPRWGH